MTYERPPTSNQCAICGQPATCSTLKDPWGKSDEMEGRCAKHSPKLRDPDDVALIDRQRAEIERLTRERDEAVTGYSVRDAEVTGLLARCAQHDKEITAFCADRDRLMKLLEIERGVALTRGQALTRALRCFDELLDNVWPNGLPSTVDAVVEQMRHALENEKYSSDETTARRMTRAEVERLGSGWLTDEQCDDVIEFLEDYEWTGLTRENVRTWSAAIESARASVSKGET